MPEQIRRGLKDTSGHINNKANRSRSGSTSMPGSKSSSAKAVQKTELDLQEVCGRCGGARLCTQGGRKGR